MTTLRSSSDAREERGLRVRAHAVHVAAVPRLAHDDPEEREHGQQDQHRERHPRPRMLIRVRPRKSKSSTRMFRPDAFELGQAPKRDERPERGDRSSSPGAS